MAAPGLPGCASAGDTLVEAFSNTEDVILTCLGVLVEDGKPLPAPSRNVPLERGSREVVGTISVDLEKINSPRTIVQPELVDLTFGRPGLTCTCYFPAGSTGCW